MRVRHLVVLVGLVPCAISGCPSPGQGVLGTRASLANDCADQQPAAPTPPPVPAADLVAAGGCGDLVAAVKAQVLRTMNATLDRNLAEALALRCQPCTARPTYDYGESGGIGCGASASSPEHGWVDAGMSVDGAHAQFDGGAGGAGGAGESASQWSTTNNQVAAVDEADFIKNDGSTIYMVANGALHVIDAWPPEQAHTLSRTKIEGTPTGLFVYGGRAVVYTNLPGSSTASTPCTYGYLCQFQGTPGPWAILVYDVSDLTNPTLVRRLELDGGLVSSRRIGSIVHSVVAFGDGMTIPANAWQDWPTELPRTVAYCGDSSLADHSADDIRRRFEELRAANARTIQAYTGSFSLPHLVDRRLEGPAWVDDSSGVADCRGFYTSPAVPGAAVVSLVSFDLAAMAPLGVTSILGQPGAVYATTQSLYVAQSSRDEGAGSGSQTARTYDFTDGTTAIHKFHLTDGSIDTRYVGTGEVDGHVLSQFSLDEKDGYLRVATTVGWARWGTSVSSLVAVLAEDEGALTLVGELDGIAPGEDIRSVLFDGDVAYIVTFKQTDPLFVVDLTDPRAPTLKSELKVPGFSTYMQMLDADHVLAIGFDAQDMGGFAWFKGIELQIFDVTDPYHPQQLHKEVIGTSGTTSEAATNHLAFNYFAPRQALALPIAICVDASGSGESYGTTMTFDGLRVYRVDVTDGFTNLGGLPLNDPGSYGAYATRCENWWTDPASGVKRSVFMDDYVWAIGTQELRVATLADLAHPVASVSVR